MEKNEKATPDQRIAHTAKHWRKQEIEAIGDKRDADKQRAEYRARQELRKTIDEAGSTES